MRRRGFFYFFHRGKPGDLRVINRLVTAAIQGTEFSYEVDPNDGTTRIVMFDGAVELSNAFGTERITSGESAIVQPGQPPRRTAVLMGGGRRQWLGQWRDLIQWCLYYPAVLDVDEAGLAPAEQQALEKYPAGRQPAAAAETVYLAALMLSVGDVKQAEEQLRKLECQPARSHGNAFRAGRRAAQAHRVREVPAMAEQSGTEACDGMDG